MTVLYEIVGARRLEADPSWMAIYHACFPEDERVPAQDLIDDVRANLSMFARAYDSESKLTLGFCIFAFLRTWRLAFLDYLATSPECQGKGIGGKLLAYAFRQADLRRNALHADFDGFVWEVEDLRRAQSEQELNQRTARIRFYERCGAELLPHTFLQPNLDGGTEVIPFRLMYKPRNISCGRPADEVLARAVMLGEYNEQCDVDLVECDRLLDVMRHIE